jgi:aerobic carbon-monoxide dehydrogenase small subunit
VQSVIAQPQPSEPATAPITEETGTFTPFVPTGTAPTAAVERTTPAFEEAPVRKGWTRFEESFVIDQPPANVWAIFADIPAVADCLPGAELTDFDARSAKGRMRVKLGPILAAFAGSAVIERDDQALRGIIRGAGSDKGTGSRTRGDVIYLVVPEGEGRTRVSIIVEYSLQGALAQFSRSSLAQDLGRRLVADFAANLNAKFGGTSAPQAAGAPLNAGRLVWLWLGDRLRRLLGR